jgi:hypothetical protein
MNVMVMDKKSLFRGQIIEEITLCQRKTKPDTYKKRAVGINFDQQKKYTKRMKNIDKIDT